MLKAILPARLLYDQRCVATVDLSEIRNRCLSLSPPSSRSSCTGFSSSGYINVRLYFFSRRCVHPDSRREVSRSPIIITPLVSLSPGASLSGLIWATRLPSDFSVSVSRVVRTLDSPLFAPLIEGPVTCAKMLVLGKFSLFLENIAVSCSLPSPASNS